MLAATGGSGFIGSYLLPRIRTEFRNLIRNPNAARPGIDIIGDMENADAIKSTVKDCDSLIHMACDNTPRTPISINPSFTSKDLISTIMLFEIFLKSNPGGHIVFFSTGGAMYDMHGLSAPISEDTVPRPWSIHAINKLAAEHYLTVLCKKYKGSATILRLSNVYGSLSQIHRNQRILGMVLASIQKNTAFQILESPQSMRDYLHLDDLVRCIQMVLQLKQENGKTRLYHVGTGQGTSLQTILNLVGKATGLKLRTEILLPMLEQKATYNVLCCNKIREELGWSAKIPIESGIENLLSKKSMLD